MGVGGACLCIYFPIRTKKKKKESGCLREGVYACILWSICRRRCECYKGLSYITWEVAAVESLSDRDQT